MAPQQASGYRTAQQLSLLYYDGLANQEQPIKLTLSHSPHATSHQQTQSSKIDEGHDLVPPLEHVIHTKWPGMVVDWNGAEPIL